MKNDEFGDRMKRYEAVTDHYLIPKVPVILRVDGRAFHTVLKNAEKPFDQKVFQAMKLVAMSLMVEIQGAKLAYSQSDEISILITDWETPQTQGWFGYRINKMVSIAAVIASRTFGIAAVEFDCRVFNLPKEEVTNYFIWRQSDAERNSVSMLAQSLYSHKELNGIGRKELIQKMLEEKDVNWNNCDPVQKRGFVIRRKPFTVAVDQLALETPQFTVERDVIDQYLW